MGRLRIGTMVSLLVLGLLAGLAFISPAARAEGTQTFSDCPTEQTLQGYMDAGGMIQYTGSTPCTIPLTSSLMMSKEVNVEIDGGVGLTLNGGTSANHGNFMLIRISNTSPSTLTLNHVTLENGLSGIGEDIGNATVNLTNSTIQDMGLLDGTNAFGIDAMTATVTNSTIARISGATNISVGIWVDTLATVTNSTIAGVSSSVAGTEVVGIWSGGDATLTSSTISGVVNSGYAPLGTGIRTADTLNLTATILADSSGRNCAAGPGNTSVSDHGYNISANAAGNDTTCHLSGTSKQNVSDSQLNLQPLADNGGPTETQALVAPSVAIDAIPLNGSQCAAGEQADQRGVARPQGSGCDVGAYELIQGSFTKTESTCPTQAQLQNDLNFGTPGATITINLPPNCTIDLVSSDPTAEPPGPGLTIGAGVDITLNGNGLTLDGQTKQFDIIDINDASSPSTLTLNTVTVENGVFGIYEAGNGTVIVTNSAVIHNGYIGISVANGTVTDSTFSDNSDGISAWNNILVTSSTISGNQVYGIVADSSATVTSSILADNPGGDCAFFASFTDSGYNLSDDDSCGFTATGSKNDVSTLKLLALGNYGGPTQTIALGPGSTAIGQIPVGTTASINGQPVTLCPSTANGSVTDQRGIVRPQGPTCDIGAYEAPALKLTASGTQGSNGYYTSAVGLTLDDSGLAPGETLDCSGASFTGLPLTATSLNQSGSSTATLSNDGSYTISCTISVVQDRTAVDLGYSATNLPVTIKLDTTKPAVSCTPSPATPPSGYYRQQAVTVNCSASDGTNGSGVASITYTLDGTATAVQGDSASFTVSGDGTHTISYYAADNAGNKSTPQTLTINIDTTKPTITITTPQDGASYALDQTVKADYRCNDTGSGVASCTGTVPDGSPIDTSSLGTHSFTVTATDKASNTFSLTVHYTIGYAMTTLPGSTTTVKQGYYAVIRFAPMDANGHDYASRNLTVTSVELDGPQGQVIPFAHPFQYGTFSGKPGYQLELNTRNLAKGKWTLKLQIGSGASATTGSVTFTVE